MTAGAGTVGGRTGDCTLAIAFLGILRMDLALLWARRVPRKGCAASTGNLGLCISPAVVTACRQASAGYREAAVMSGANTTGLRIERSPF